MAPKHYSKALKFIETRWKKYYFDKIISHIFRLDQANDALRSVETGTAVKAIIVPHS